MDLVPATVVPHAAKDTRQPILIKALVFAFAVLKIFCKIRDDASFMTIAVDLIEDGTRILDSMKIKVVSRRYFEKLKGSPELAAVISSHRIVSIQSSHGSDSRPPFSAGVLPHPNILCIRFDDYCSFEEGCVDRNVPWLFRRDDAERIVRFVVDDEKPLIVQCTAGISRSGAVGKAFDWYYNQQLHDNPDDHEFFVKNNPQISPNRLVFEIMMAYLEEPRKTRWTESL